MKNMVLLFGFLIFSCQTSKRSSQVQNNCNSPEFTNFIGDKATFECMANDIDVGGTTQRVVKFVYDRRSNDKKIYFFDTNRFQYHYDFSRGHLGVTENPDSFASNYIGDGSDRNFFLGSLVIYAETNGVDAASFKTLFELWDGDEMTTPSMEELWTALSRSLDLNSLPPFYYHPISDVQVEMARSSSTLKYLTTADLYGNREYFALNTGEAVGYLTYVDNSQEGEVPCLDFTKIPIFERVPNELGLVGGVITSTFQTPLSHVNVKSKNRGTMNMSLTNAAQKLRQFIGQPVRIKVESGSYEITPISGGEVDSYMNQFWEERRPRLNGQPVAILGSEFAGKFVDLREYFERNNRGGRYFNNAIPTKSAHQRMVQIVGAKATNLGVIDLLFNSSGDMRSLGVVSPNTYGVPFDFFEEFMNTKQPGLDPNNPERVSTPQAMVNEILYAHGMLDPNRVHSICNVKTPLAQIREIIQRGKVPDSMFALFKKYLIDDRSSEIHISKIPSLRLRSSTNSEDLEGFTGAGLYNSDSIRLYDKTARGGYDSTRPRSWAKIKKKLSEVIPYLYSSVWNDRAFEEREWYSMNGTQHLDVKVGLAAQRSYPLWDFDDAPGEVANGVVVTRDINSPDEPRKAYINAQHYDLAITNPPTPEELEEVGEDPNQNYMTEEIVAVTMAANENDMWDWQGWSYGVVRRSSVRGGEPVLIDNPMTRSFPMEVRSLAYVSQYISDSFADLLNKNPFEFAIDIEWKILGQNRQLLIKQARPFESFQQGGTMRPQGMTFRSSSQPKGPVSRGPNPRRFFD
jgi:hypothetical protein